MAYSCCFSIGGNLYFLYFSIKSFITSTKVLFWKTSLYKLNYSVTVYVKKGCFFNIWSHCLRSSKRRISLKMLSRNPPKLKHGTWQIIFSQSFSSWCSVKNSISKSTWKRFPGRMTSLTYTAFMYFIKFGLFRSLFHLFSPLLPMFLFNSTRQSW